MLAHLGVNASNKCSKADAIDVTTFHSFNLAHDQSCASLESSWGIAMLSCAYLQMTYGSFATVADSVGALRYLAPFDTLPNTDLQYGSKEISHVLGAAKQLLE